MHAPAISHRGIRTEQDIVDAASTRRQIARRRRLPHIRDKRRRRFSRSRSNRICADQRPDLRSRIGRQRSSGAAPGRGVLADYLIMWNVLQERRVQCAVQSLAVEIPLRHRPQSETRQLDRMDARQRDSRSQPVDRLRRAGQLVVEGHQLLERGDVLPAERIGLFNENRANGFALASSSVTAVAAALCLASAADSASQADTGDCRALPCRTPQYAVDQIPLGSVGHIALAHGTYEAPVNLYYHRFVTFEGDCLDWGAVVIENPSKAEAAFLVQDQAIGIITVSVLRSHQPCRVQMALRDARAQSSIMLQSVSADATSPVRPSTRFLGLAKAPRGHPAAAPVVSS